MLLLPISAKYVDGEHKKLIPFQAKVISSKIISKNDNYLHGLSWNYGQSKSYGFHIISKETPINSIARA